MRQAENLRKMLCHAKDVRVLLISWPTACTTCAPWLPGRSEAAPHRRRTLEVYAQLANRLGITNGNGSWKTAAWRCFTRPSTPSCRELAGLQSDRAAA